MRHRKSGRHLNRSSSHRQAMFRNMAASLIEHELIKTTLPKAKELRRVVEPLITLAKQDSIANRRLAFARTRNAAAVAKLFTDLGPRYAERPGGYTRVLKCGHRRGDSAPMAYIELVGSQLDISDEAADEQGTKQEALPLPSEAAPQEAIADEAPAAAAEPKAAEESPTAESPADQEPATTPEPEAPPPQGDATESAPGNAEPSEPTTAPPAEAPDQPEK